MIYLALDRFSGTGPVQTMETPVMVGDAMHEPLR